MTGPALALGTVQFGLAYGVAGPGAPVPEAEVRAILRRAWELGIRRLDTAPAYGGIEARLADLAGDLPFSIVSKVAALPAAANAEEARTFIAGSVRQSGARLGERLDGLLLHNADDLLGPHGPVIWEALTAMAGAIGLGPSCYDAETLTKVQALFPATMAQLPGNALDQGLARVPPALSIEISLRSVLLQGLLLMPRREAEAKVPAAGPALARWHHFCVEGGIAPLIAALSVVKGMPQVDYCLVGVDTIGQLEEVAAAWAQASPIAAPWLDTRKPEVIDPRRWKQG